MKIIKPMTLSLLHRSFTIRQQHHLSVAVLGFFSLRDGCATRLLDEAPQWKRILPHLPAGTPLDEAMPKAHAEALLLGAACAPSGELRQTIQVRMSVGANIDKRLLAYGDRRWRYGVAPLFSIAPPQPTARIPLVWANAYGGKGCADNPDGRGYPSGSTAALTSHNEGWMPNLEYADSPIERLGRAYPPASLGPVPTTWPVRARHAGTYDKRWIAEVCPALPDDLHWSTYNQASLDQRTDEDFGPGDGFCLEGVSELHSRIEGQLPNHRVRAFIRQSAAASGSDCPLEVPLRFNTVWFVPDEDIGIAIWRGTRVVDELDAADVSTLMVAYESGESLPRPMQHYADVMALRTDRSTAGLHAFNESQLAPEQSGRKAPHTQPQHSLAQQRIDKIHETLLSQAEGLDIVPPEPPQAAPPLLIPPDADAIRQGDFDLTDWMQQVDKLKNDVEESATAWRQFQKEKLADIRELTQQDTAAQDASSQKASGCDKLPWEAVLRKASGEDQQEAIETMALAMSSGHSDSQKREEATSAVVQAIALKHQARLASPSPLDAAQELPPELAHRLGAEVMRWHSQGIALAGRDLAGASLRGVDLRGADLRGCMLERVDFSDSMLDGVDLSRAALTQARLDGTSLRGAILKDANLTGSVSTGADMSGALLSGCRADQCDWHNARLVGATIISASFNEARLTGADLSNAKLETTLFTQAELDHSLWANVQAQRCVLIKAKAKGANFSQSTWVRSAFTESRWTRCSWARASLEQSEFTRSVWAGSDLSRLTASKCNWLKASMDHCSLAGASIQDCNLGSTKLHGVNLNHSCFARSLFVGARIENSNATEADFFRALLRRAMFDETPLTHASFYGAELTGINIRACELRGLKLDAKREIA